MSASSEAFFCRAVTESFRCHSNDAVVTRKKQQKTKTAYLRLNSGAWEQNSNKPVAVLALRPELCFGSHHRKSILTVALTASEGQEFTSAFFNYVDVLSSWSLSSGRDGFGEGEGGSGGGLTRRLPL